MKALRIPEAVGFEARVRDLLLEREAENNLMLGIAALLAERPPSPGEERYFWAVTEGVRTVGAALWTPPFKPVVSRLEEGVMEALLAAMTQGVPPLEGVSGPEPSAERFAGAWSRVFGLPFRRIMGMWIRELTGVNDVEVPPGRFRMAQDRDIPRAVEWFTAFHEEVGLDEPINALKEAGDYVRDGRLFLWEKDGEPVSCAGFVGPTPNGVRVNAVYTPDAERGRGYSTACVASLSRYLLARGKGSVYLFSDASNPVSNRVYDHVGFRTVCDWGMYGFPLTKDGKVDHPQGPRPPR